MPNSFRFLLAALCLLLPLAAQAHMAVTDAQARVIDAETGTVAIYVELYNHASQTDQLSRVEASAAASATLLDATGAPLRDGITIAAGDRHSLAQNGDHILLTGLPGPLLPGAEIELLLVFEVWLPELISVPILPD